MSDLIDLVYLNIPYLKSKRVEVRRTVHSSTIPISFDESTDVGVTFQR